MMGSGSSDASVGSSTPLDQIKAAINADASGAAKDGACHAPFSSAHAAHPVCLAVLIIADFMTHPSDL